METAVFIVNEWSGALQTQTDETIDARFFDLDNLPLDVPDFYHETIADLHHYRETGEFVLK
ncbi:MAG: hypothetical protein GY943_07375 [Chloroflexi bacterium]|nr:hypothetical protein [Chloroflexota bacterium]